MKLKPLPDDGDCRGWTLRIRQIAVVLVLLAVAGGCLAAWTNPTSQLSYIFYVVGTATVGAALLREVDKR